VVPLYQALLVGQPVKNWRRGPQTRQRIVSLIACTRQMFAGVVKMPTLKLYCRLAKRGIKSCFESLA
jgi:hypothetical protein